MRHLRHVTYKNIRAIILGKLRGTSQSEVGYSLGGLHRTTIANIMEEPAYKSVVDDVETFLMAGQLDDDRKRKNAILLKSLQMSHLNCADVLKTAQQLANDQVRDIPEAHPIHIDLEDVERFKEYFGIEF